MSDEETKQNGQTKPKGITQAWAIIIGALLAFLGVVLGLVVPRQCDTKPKPEEPKELYLTITLRNADTGERVGGYVFINNAAAGTFIDPVEAPRNIPLSKGYYTIRVKCEGYFEEEIPVDFYGAPLDIPVRKIAEEEEEEPPKPELFPLPMSSWHPWTGITITGGATSNECIIGSRGRLADSAGIVNEHLGAALRGKTLILCFANTGASRFSEGRMAKLEGDNFLLLPDNAFPVKGFLPAEDRLPPNGFEFKIPDSINGKLNIVFYQAELKNLKITAYYK